MFEINEFDLLDLEEICILLLLLTEAADLLPRWKYDIWEAPEIFELPVIDK